jgi:hypothetical protein
MRKYCDGQNIDLDIWTNLHVLSHPEYDKLVFGVPSF